MQNIVEWNLLSKVLETSIHDPAGDHLRGEVDFKHIQKRATMVRERKKRERERKRECVVCVSVQQRPLVGTNYPVHRAAPALPAEMPLIDDAMSVDNAMSVDDAMNGLE